MKHISVIWMCVGVGMPNRSTEFEKMSSSSFPPSVSPPYYLSYVGLAVKNGTYSRTLFSYLTTTCFTPFTPLRENTNIGFNLNLWGFQSDGNWLKRVGRCRIIERRIPHCVGFLFSWRHSCCGFALEHDPVICVISSAQFPWLYYKYICCLYSM